MSSASNFNKDYFENGVKLGISLYENYRYLPERSLAEAEVVSNALDLEYGEKFLDFGCAKGFLVKALLEWGHEAYGCDISEYAIRHAEPEIKDRIYLLKESTPLIPERFAAGFAKDVLEHAYEIDPVLQTMSALAKRWLLVVPLAENGTYVCTEYEQDVTHIIREDKQWWLSALARNGFEVSRHSFSLSGLKEKWTERYEFGNLFVWAESRLFDPASL